MRYMTVTNNAVLKKYGSLVFFYIPSVIKKIMPFFMSVTTSERRT